MPDRTSPDAGPLTQDEIDELSGQLAEVAQVIERMMRGMARGPSYSRRIALAEAGHASATLGTVSTLLAGEP